MQGQGQQQQQQLQHRVPVQNSYMQNRAQALHNVESTITELSSIFTQLSTMVSQQGEVALRYRVHLHCFMWNLDLSTSYSAGQSIPFAAFHLILMDFLQFLRVNFNNW
jgi:syntaxin 5